MPVFYPGARHRFYVGGSFRCISCAARFLRLDVASEVEVNEIVYRMSEILFTAEIAFCCLHGCMPQRELNLPQLTAAAVA